MLLRFLNNCKLWFAHCAFIFTLTEFAFSNMKMYSHYVYIYPNAVIQFQLENGRFHKPSKTKKSFEKREKSASVSEILSQKSRRAAIGWLIRSAAL